MELFSFDWLIGLVLLAGGIVVGVILARWLFADSGREKELRTELERTREEYASYRNDVSVHFRETAQAVNQMTESYRSVYEQLRRGAEHLCSAGGEKLLEPTAAPLIASTSEADTAAVPEEPPVATEEPEAAATPEEEEGAQPVADAGSATESAAAEAVSPVEPATAAPVEAVSPVEPATAAPEEPRPPLDYPLDTEEERNKTVH